MRRIFAREIARSERRRAGGSPGGQRAPLDHRQRLTGLARQQQILPVDGRPLQFRIVGKHGDDLAADIALVAAAPCRHQQQCRVRARLRNGVMMAGRNRDIALEGIRQRVNQSAIGQDFLDIVG